MPLYSVLTVLHTTNNQVEDYATNTMHFDADGVAPLADAEAALLEFYRDLGQLYPDTIRLDQHEFKWYNLADPKPRAPVREETWAFLAAPSGSPLPSECAIVLSFQAPKLSGVPQPRRRNRIYVGPIETGRVDGDGRINVGTTQTISDAAADLRTASQAATDWTWFVYSPTSGQGEPVTDGWVDNAWDTQRRRGVSSTIRTTWP